jgi:hypothetical protein
MATQQSADTLVDGTANKVMTAAERVALAAAAPSSSLTGKKNVADVWRRDFPLIGNPNTMSGGTWTYGGYYGYNSAGATNATYNSVWFFDLEPGTWSFDVHGLKSTNSGINTYEYSFDNSNWNTIAASVDMYQASLAAASAGSVTGVVVAAQTRFYVRVRNAGTKNASSTAYFALVCALHARRTA